jgi:hypothetical protein
MTAAPMCARGPGPCHPSLFYQPSDIHGEELKLLSSPFIHQRLYSPLLGPGLSLSLSFSFVIFFTQKVGLLGRVISPSQGRYLHTGQHKRRINAHTFMPWVGFEPMISAFERAKTVHALDRAVTVIGTEFFIIQFSPVTFYIALLNSNYPLQHPFSATSQSSGQYSYFVFGTSQVQISACTSTTLKGFMFYSAILCKCRDITSN